MNSTLLHWIGDQARTLCLQVPLPWVRGALIAIPIALMFWVILLPAHRTTPADRPATRTDNLKLWAWLALLGQVILYAIF